MSFEDLRRQYTLDGLLESGAAASPVDQFNGWMQAALDSAPAEWVEPYAMTLSTSDNGGQVSSRIVLLRGFDEEGFVFYTNYESQKGKALKSHPQAALLFYWGYLERQVRVSGNVSRIDHKQSEAYFHRRPRASQISASISRQSERVASREELETAAQKMADALGEDPVPLPDFWGGYRLVPDRFEFWQGRADRLHDRLVYEQTAEGWARFRVSP